jgi:hypothetical protein
MQEAMANRTRVDEVGPFHRKLARNQEEFLLASNVRVNVRNIRESHAVQQAGGLVSRRWVCVHGVRGRGECE